MTPFGQTVLFWRMSRGMTQQALAARSHIPRSNLSAIEGGRREVTLQTLRALASALNVPPGMLVDGVLPPSEGSPRRQLSREEMERIADHVVSTAPVRRETDRFLIETLRRLVAPKAHAYHKPWKTPRWSNRKTNLAWLQLRARYPSSVVDSLLSRITDRLHRP